MQRVFLTKGKDVLKVVNHSCQPDIVAYEVKKCENIMKMRAREENTPLTEIYLKEIKNVMVKGFDFIKEITLYSTAKHPLNDIRNKARGSSKDSTCTENIVLIDYIYLHENKENFLLFDSGTKDRIIAFATAIGKEVLTTNEAFFMNGTFKSCSKQFTQIYSIQVDIGSNTNETNLVTDVYSLLPNKQKETYERFFMPLLLQQHIPN
jgi:hypothetical protein